MKWSGQTAVTVAAVLMSLAVAGCASSRPGSGPAPVSSASEPAPAISASGPAPASFAGYRWVVTAIAHGAKPIPIPGRYDVYLEFTPNGEFVANEPANTHSGTYRQAGNGFTTSELASTQVLSIGGDMARRLSIGAISAFDDGRHASTTVSGDRLTVSVGGYRLDCQRDGRQSDFPPAQPT